MNSTSISNKRKFDVSALLILLILCGCFGHAYNYQFNLVCVILLLVSCLLRFIVDIKYGCKDKYKISFGYFKWYLVFIIFNIISLKWTLNYEFSMNLIKDLLSTFIFVFAITFYINDKEKLNLVLKCILIACFYMTIKLLIYDFDVKFTDAFGESIGLYFNRLALILNYAICICIYFMKKEKNMLYILLIILFYYVIYLTGSRKSLIFTPMFIILFYLLNGKFNLKKIFKNIIVIFMALLSFTIVINSNEALKNDMNQLINSTINNTATTDGSIKERNYYKRTAYNIFKDNMIKGVGANGFRAHLQRIGYKHVTYSHCNYLELLSTLGIIGFIIYYYIYFKSILNCFKGFNKNNLEKTIVLTFFIVEIIIEYGFVSFYFFEFQVIIAIMYMLSCFYKKGGDLDENRDNCTIS